jgi:hypothetical protein
MQRQVFEVCQIRLEAPVAIDHDDAACGRIEHHAASAAPAAASAGGNAGRPS